MYRTSGGLLSLRFAVLNAAHHGDTSSGSNAFLKRHMSYMSFTRRCGKSDAKPKVVLTSLLVVFMSALFLNSVCSTNVSSFSSTVELHFGQWS